MSPFRPLAKRDRLRKNGGLRFAGDGKPLQNNLRAGQQALSLVAIFVPSLQNTKQILQILLDYKTNSFSFFGGIFSTLPENTKTKQILQLHASL